MLEQTERIGRAQRLDARTPVRAGQPGERFTLSDLALAQRNVYAAVDSRRNVCCRGVDLCNIHLTLEANCGMKYRVSGSSRVLMKLDDDESKPSS